MSDLDLTPLMPAVARRLWGDPRPGSTKTEVRFGDGRTINPIKGSWWSHQEQLGGGVMKLIEHELKLKGAEAIKWLNENVGAQIEVRVNGHDHHHAAVAYTPPGKPIASMDPAKARVVATYDYTDASGALVYQVLRKEDGSVDPKTGKPRKNFGQRRPDGRGGWIYDLQGVTPTLFRLPELQEAIATDTLVFIVEGEKKVEALAEIGVPATCNSGGAKKWRDEFAEHFAGADVIIMPDNDDPGREHAKVVAAALAGTAKRVRVLDLPGLDEKGDVVDWLAKGGTIERLYDLVASDARDPTKEPYVSPFHVVPFWEIDKPGPEHEWLIKGLITMAEVGLLAGESGTGKSFVAIDAGMAIARGTSWMGRRVEQGAVLYVAGEGGLGVKKRLRAYRQEHGISADERVPFILIPEPIDLYKGEEHADQLIVEAQHWAAQLPDDPIRLIVIDTFSASTPGADENSAKDMSPVLQRGARLARATGAAVIFVQHMNASGEKVRGWTGIKANVDSVLICRKTETKDENGNWIYEVELDKCKDGVRGLTWNYVLDSVELGTDRHGDAITSCIVVEPSGSGKDAPDYSTFTTNMRDTFAAIKKAITLYGEKTPGGLSLPMSITTVTTLQGVVEAYMRDILVVDANAPDADRARARETARKSIQRGGADLRDRGYIGRESKWIWLTGKEPMNTVSTRRKPGRKPPGKPEGEVF